MLRDLPDYFSHQVRRSALVFLVRSLCQVWPGLECIWGDITEGGFYFDFHLPHLPPPDFAERTQRKFEANVKSRVELRSVQRLKGNAADWFDLKGQCHRAEIIRNSQEPVIHLAALNEFLEPCSGEIARQMPMVELLLEGPLSLDREKLSSKKRGWRLQGQLFSSRQSRARFAQKKKKLIANKLTHLQLGSSLNFFEIDAKGDNISIWKCRGLAAQRRLLKWWTALQKNNDVKLFSRAQVEPYPQPSEVPGPTRICQLPSVIKEKRHAVPSRWSTWQWVDSKRQQGQLNPLLAQRYFWKDQTDVFCAKEQILIEFNSALKLIELASRPFGFESTWLIASPPKANLFFSASANWQVAAFTGLRCPIADQRSEDSITIKARLAIKDANGRWWPTGFASIRIDQKPAVQSKRAHFDCQGRWAVSYSLMGDLERYLALILESQSGQLPPWLAAASLLVITDSDQSSVECVKKDFAKKEIDIHFQHCSNTTHLRSEIQRAFCRNETFVASLQNDQNGTFYMRYFSAKENDVGQIDAARYTHLADQSFFSALSDNPSVGTRLENK